MLQSIGFFERQFSSRCLAFLTDDSGVKLGQLVREVDERCEKLEMFMLEKRGYLRENILLTIQNSLPQVKLMVFINYDSARKSSLKNKSTFHAHYIILASSDFFIMQTHSESANFSRDLKLLKPRNLMAPL